MMPMELPSVLIVNTQPEHIPALAAMQRIIYPTLSADELISEDKFLKHLELFPEGQFCALVQEGDQLIPVGSTSTFRTHFDFKDYNHTFLQAFAHGWLTNHDSGGDWLYGVDMAVHPAYRGRRIGRYLYDARRRLVQKMNLRGEIAGGMLPGYHHHRSHITVAQYVLRVWQQKLTDPTLSMQIKNGFRPRGILYNHITDPRSNDTATLIVRENPHYRANDRSASPPQRSRIKIFAYRSDV